MSTLNTCKCKKRNVLIVCWKVTFRKHLYGSFAKSCHTLRNVFRVLFFMIWPPSFYLFSTHTHISICTYMWMSKIMVHKTGIFSQMHLPLLHHNLCECLFARRLSPKHTHTLANIYSVWELWLLRLCFGMLWEFNNVVQRLAWTCCCLMHDCCCLVVLQWFYHMVNTT